MAPQWGTVEHSPPCQPHATPLRHVADIDEHIRQVNHSTAQNAAVRLVEEMEAMLTRRTHLPPDINTHRPANRRRVNWQVHDSAIVDGQAFAFDELFGPTAPEPASQPDDVLYVQLMENSDPPRLVVRHGNADVPTEIVTHDLTRYPSSMWEWLQRTVQDCCQMGGRAQLVTRAIAIAWGTMPRAMQADTWAVRDRLRLAAQGASQDQPQPDPRSRRRRR